MRIGGAPGRLVRLFFVMLSAARVGAAADAPRPLDLDDLGAPTFTSFTPRDGVPEAVVTALATDAEGFVWLASPSSLARYDGNRWSSMPTPRGGRVRDLFLDHSGTFWAALDDKGLAHLEDGRWSVEDRATGLPTNNLFRVAETRDRAGRVETWALTADAGLLLRVAGRWVPDPDNEQLPTGSLHGIARTVDIGGRERLWVATFNEGVWYREEGNGWRRYRVEGFDPGQVDDILVTRHHDREELWIATYGLGLWRLTPEGIEAIRPQGDAGRAADILYALKASAGPDGERVVWGASRGGLIRVHADTMQVFDRRHGLPSNVVRNLHLWRSADGADVLWLATEAGVARTVLGKTPWRTASLLGSSGNGVFGVLVEPDGRGGERLWVAASNDGVGLYEGGRWRTFGEAGGALPSPHGRMVVRTSDGAGGSELWIGFGGGELVRVHEAREGGAAGAAGPRFERVQTPWPKHAGQAVMDLVTRAVDGHVERWVATRQSGIWRLRDGRWTGFRAGAAVGQWRVAKLLEQVDEDGRSWLWATSNEGLARFDGVAWALFGREEGLPDVELIGLTSIPGAGGRPVLWAGSNRSGIVRIDVSDPLRPRVLPSNELPNPPDPTAYGAERDSKGNIYVCTNNGVQLLMPDPLSGFRERVFRRRDGLVHEECNTNAQQVDAHDRYWMGTLGGLAVYDPAALPSNPRAKPLKLTRVRVDGLDVDPSAVRVPPRARELRFEFALLAWQRESESRFRSQLIGYDPEPGFWLPQNFRVFGALPPARYVLRVEARDYAGQESAPLEIPVDVIPVWWQTVWFRIALVAFFALAGPLFYLWRVRRLSRQKAALEALVLSRTSELAAANERLAHLSREDQLTGVANRRRLDEVLDEEWRRGVRLETPLAFLLLDVDHFKSYNDRLGHQAGDACLAAVAAAVAGVHTRAGEFVARYGGEEFAVLIPGVDREAASVSAENVRRRVFGMNLHHPCSAVSPNVTVSVGVAWMRPGIDAGSSADLVGAADRALYRAKAEGRNCVRS